MVGLCGVVGVCWSLGWIGNVVILLLDVVIGIGWEFGFWMVSWVIPPSHVLADCRRGMGWLDVGMDGQTGG
jgi:hypothetical protein